MFKSLSALLWWRSSPPEPQPHYLRAATLYGPGSHHHEHALRMVAAGQPQPGPTQPALAPPQPPAGPGSERA